MAEQKQLDTLIINKVENEDVFNYIKTNGLINDDELYFVEGDDSYAQSDLSNVENTNFLNKGIESGLATDAVKYVSQSLTDAQKIQARTNIGAGTGDGNCSSIVVNDVVVATSDWNSSTAYSSYPYEASITVSGCTTNHVPEVIFSVADAISNAFAPICVSGTDTVIIYATEIPSDAMTIPTIECRKSL